LPPQRFARSRGVAPPTACRPCFMPVPPMGFSPSRSIPPAERSALSSTPALLWLSWLRASTRAPRCRQAAWERPALERGGVGRETASCPALHFRALIPASVRTRRWRFRPVAEPRPSWGSSSLGASPSPPETSPEVYPLSSFTIAAHARAKAAPQSLAGEEIGLTLSSLPPLPRFLHLIDEPRSTQRG